MIGSTRAIDWPDPASIKIGTKGYDTPEGVFPRVTSILKVLGLGTEGLIKWSANEERKACIEAASETYSEMESAGVPWLSPVGFVGRVEARLGPARQHQRQLSKAADIGTAAHAAIHEYLKNPDAPMNPTLRPESVLALTAFVSWWKGSGLKSVRMEQPVWDAKLGYAGTIDLIAEHPRLGLGVVDFKTSKGLYDTHHLQVAAYVHAGSNWSDLRWAQIVRLPKTLDDPGFEMKAAGDMYDRRLDQDQMMTAFRAAVSLHNLLVTKQEA